MITYVYEICGSEYQAAVTILQSGVPWTIGYSVIAFIGIVGHFVSFTVPGGPNPAKETLVI